MIVDQTNNFKSWLIDLKDKVAKSAIQTRIDRLEDGNLGDFKIIGDVTELRIHVSAGYRLYCHKTGNVYILLLCGGSKSTQKKDIKLALEMINLLKASKK